MISQATGARVASQAEPVAYCADIGGSFIKFGRAYGPGDVSVEEHVPTPVASWQGFMDALAGLLERHGPESRPLPLAISIAGLFDTRTGRVTAANIPCFMHHDLITELSSYLGRKVLIANDADSFALAEANIGVGRGHEVVMCIILGTGVGGGLVAGGRLVQGAGGVTAEWGHGSIVQTSVTLPGSGEQIVVPRFACGCGQSGCTDTIGGARGIERLHRHLTGHRRSSHDILDAWEVGDPVAGRTVCVYLELLSEPLAYAINITGASMVPVGGGLATRPALIDALDRAVRKRTLNAYTEQLVLPGRHITDGGLVGVSVLASQQ
ncbi:ROK family protein [Chelativorans sp. AA-79]|uniref:ROK family protein n=1 Tax=Chelativorans sp. AA-79 TaxID=3028735 RepID=UPI0023F80EB2|nr:ROK family protein [Chelativorans sp. AA-79]WEX11016.1 ROK family protein [Chelativorans sp. AA-79]